MFHEIHRAKQHVTRELSEYFRPGRAWHRGRVSAALALLAVVTLASTSGLRRPLNLAREKLATSSTVAHGTKPAGAVDGLRYGQLGFHSGHESQPWLLVDLGAPHSLTEVTVFGRADCCFDQSIPLVLELSQDGKHFALAGRREAPFTQFEPWEVSLRPARQARFVRLRADKTGLLVLSEIEVYGR